MQGSQRTIKAMLSWGCALVLLAWCLLGMTGCFEQEQEKPSITVASESVEDDIKKSLDVDMMLSTSFHYDGVATKYEKGTKEPACKIEYPAEITVGVKASKIRVMVDNDAKVVTLQLPKVKVDHIEVDRLWMKLIPATYLITMDDMVALCERNALKAVTKNDEVHAQAVQALQESIQELLSPALSSVEYELQWKQG